jgi:hypothetical protein
MAGIDEGERQELFAEHRARLEARLEEVRSLLDAVDQLTTKGTDTMSTPTPAPTERTSSTGSSDFLGASGCCQNGTYRARGSYTFDFGSGTEVGSRVQTETQYTGARSIACQY